MKKNLILGATLLLLLTACGGTSSQSNEPVHSVMTVQPVGASTQMQQTFAGQVEEGREIGVGFKTGGQLARVLVKEGDYVHQGQLIATLDDKDIQLTLKGIQIQYDQMKRQVERMKKLYDAKSLSGNDYDKAASGLEQLQVNLETQQNKLDYTKLYAPTSGYVQKVNFEMAEMVGAGTAIIQLLDVSQMEVSFYIPTSVYLQKDRLKGFSCSGAFSQGTQVPVKLLSITPKADNSQLYKVRLGLNPTDAKNVTAGMNVEVSVDVEGNNAAQGMTLPMSAVFNQEGKTYVWVVDKDNKVHKQAVTVGQLAEGNQVNIAQGLNGTEQVVKAGVNVLQDQEQVKIITAPSKTNIGGLI